MKKKILIIGSGGMLGWKVSEYFSNKFYPITLTYRNEQDKNNLSKIIKKKNIKWKKLDILKINNKKFKNFLKKFDYIINCAGIIKPEINESNSTSILNCLKINSFFPHLLNEKKKKETKVFQIATDCVYDGLKGGYNENFPHNANDIYGKSKSIGEVKAENFYNLRVSIVGKEIKGFKSLISWFLKKENKKINGFSNHIWNGITTLAFAKIVYSAIKNNISLPNTLHIIPKDIVSKFELLKYFLKFRFNVDVLKKKSTQQIDRTLKTINKKTLRKLWLHSEYKKIPTIKEIINEI